MLIYIHGFNSSALSYKAGLVRKRMIELGRAEMFLCPELPPSPRNAIGLLEHEIEAHGRENVSLIGSSLGGYYATWLAERHAEFARQTSQNLTYIALSAEPDEFENVVDRFRREGGRGMNVTLPFKHRAFALANERSARAVQAEAANTLTFSESAVAADNTDGVGLVRDLTSNLGCTLSGARILLMIEPGEAGQHLADVLLRKRPQGVAVNLIYDAVGSIDTPPEYFDRLREAGVNVLEFNPLNPLKTRNGWRINNRDHSKLVIVDGTTAFTGGINISDVYSSGSSPGPSGSRRGGSGKRSRDVGWRDVNVRLEGPAVAELQRIFLATWAAQAGTPLPQRNWFPSIKPQGGGHPVRVVSSGPEDAAPAIYIALVSAIEHAEKTIHITMAYFVPDAQTIEALKHAAARGVDVTLVLPSYTDFWAVFHAGRSHYSELLESGVKIYERQAVLLHSKTAVIDGVWSTVGSSNMFTPRRIACTNWPMPMEAESPSPETPMYSSSRLARFAPVSTEGMGGRRCGRESREKRSIPS